MRTRHEIPAFIICESAYEGILIADIEVKVRSDECLAKCTAVVWGEDTYFDNDTSGDFRSNLIDGAIPMWAV